LNVLLITLDQLRGDSIGCAGHPLVRTPGLDRLASGGVHFARHYSQSAPCSPGRASLYTGMYQMNHRVLGNGTPLDRRFDNVALAARRAGHDDPVLFGYTDQSVDPRDTSGPDDWRLRSYEGVLPGFRAELDLTGRYGPWLAFLERNGHSSLPGVIELLATEHERPAEVSCSTFVTDTFLEWLSTRTDTWFAHVSYIRPHPPYSAAGEYGSMYDPADVPAAIGLAPGRHPLHDFILGNPDVAAPAGDDAVRRMRTQYYGMISEVDAQLVRLWDALERRGEWDRTLVIVTSDHGEMLGDHGLKEKVGYWEQSYHVPCIVRDPRHPAAHGSTVGDFTENVDIMPTLCEALGVAVPAQCDGFPLTPFLRGETPPHWRTAASWEYDWSPQLIPLDEYPLPWDRRLQRCSLAVRRTETHALVQFADGSSMCFDLVADPTWRTTTSDSGVVAALAGEMLGWRMQHANRELTGALVQRGVVGRWPEGVPWRAPQDSVG